MTKLEGLSGARSGLPIRVTRNSIPSARIHLCTASVTVRGWGWTLLSLFEGV